MSNSLWPYEPQDARPPYPSPTAAAAKSLQLCPTLCDPIEGSPLGSPVPGILQARTLEWVAISFSNGWKWKVKVKLLSRVWVFTTTWTAAYQAGSSAHGIFQARVLESTQTGVYPNPCSLSQWYHPTISSSVIPFSSCPQSFPESGSFQMSQLFASGGQSIGVSAWTWVLPMNTQDWSPLGWTG